MHTIYHVQIACVQTSPLPQKKSGEETSPDFFWGRGTSVQRLCRDNPCWLTKSLLQWLHLILLDIVETKSGTFVSITLFLCEMLFLKPKRPSVVWRDILTEKRWSTCTILKRKCQPGPEKQHSYKKKEFIC